jgi:hypothetical protein
MKPIKLMVILQHALGFLLVGLGLHTIADLAVLEHNKVVSEAVMSDEPLAMVSVFLGILLQHSGTPPAMLWVAIFECALLWGIFIERREQYDLLEAMPIRWVVLLFIFSSWLAIPGAFYSIISTLYSYSRIKNSIQSFLALLALPAIITRFALGLTPLFISLSSGKVLYKRYKSRKIPASPH